VERGLERREVRRTSGISCEGNKNKNKKEKKKKPSQKKLCFDQEQKCFNLKTAARRQKERKFTKEKKEKEKEERDG